MTEQVIFDIECMQGWQKDLVTGMRTGEMTILMAGRQTGKSQMVAYQRLWEDMMTRPVKILWQKLPGRKLKAYTDGTGRGLRDNDMDEVQQWIWTNIPSAKRLSFDMWLFKEDKHVTMFLMRWTS